MSDVPPTVHRALHLVLPSFPADRINEIAASSANAEVFPLTDANAREALEKIFAADSIAVWTELK